MRNASDPADAKVIAIEVLDIEDSGSEAAVTFSRTTDTGKTEVCRVDIRRLQRYSSLCFLAEADTICRAEFIGKVYRGLIKSDVRMLFLITWRDGSVRLVQEKSGSPACRRLQKLCVQPSEAPKRSTADSGPARAYPLKVNELPQGEYVIGTDIPVGVYDFFVTYGTDGRFLLAFYDEQNEIRDGTMESYWVGLKEPYEHRELIHIRCREGMRLSISGNVILKIARSNSVRLEL